MIVKKERAEGEERKKMAERKNNGLKRWRGGALIEQGLLFQGTKVQFPAPTRKPITSLTPCPLLVQWAMQAHGVLRYAGKHQYT